MQTTKAKRETQVCANCDAPARKLAQLTRVTPSGARLIRMVCAFCYLQLGPRQKRLRL